MMTQICEAVYENGIFRPIEPNAKGFREGEQVRLIVEIISPEDILALATKVYEGLSEQEIDEVEKIALDRSNFFVERKS